MSEREERDLLARIINEHMEADVPETVADKHEPVDADYAMADAILAAGFRPPARVVTTVEELDALPEQAVIRDREGTVAELAFGMWFSSDGRVFGLRLPATVLYEPKEGK